MVVYEGCLPGIACLEGPDCTRSDLCPLVSLGRRTLCRSRPCLSMVNGRFVYE